VNEVTGLVVRATVAGARLGEIAILGSGDGSDPLSRVPAEVVGFRGDEVVLMPLGPLPAIGPDAVVSPTGRRLLVRVGDGLLGRVLDGLGRPMDGGGLVAGRTEEWPVDRGAPDPLLRRRIARPLSFGIRAIDGCLTVGEGQRIGVFAGSGLGKSQLLGQIARQADSDVNVVCLVGERGREVRELWDEAIGQEGRGRCVLVCATGDEAALLRIKSTLVATAIAEWFRARGRRVLLLLDSLTRLAHAQREVGLAAGELPVRQGYPPSVFALLPRLLERAGNAQHGSITALYTVLLPGGDMEEPIADEARAALDGHIVLSRNMAERGHWPAIDVLASLSRVMGLVVDAGQGEAAAKLRELIACYEEKRDLIALGAYRAGSDARVDRALAKMAAIDGFLRQGLRERSSPGQTRQRLLALL
jgi:type III secretion protein N (ATPase)